ARTRPRRPPYELGQEPDTIIGRTTELARLAEFLEGHDAGACVAVVGPQGIGKARLVLEAARRTSDLVMFIAAPDPSGHQQSWYPILSMIEAGPRPPPPPRPRRAAPTAGPPRLSPPRPAPPAAP